MKVKDSTAYKCRWSEEFLKGLEEFEVVKDNSESDYSGKVDLICYDLSSDSYIYIQYYYGSCNYCDGYEDMPEEQLEEERVRLTFTMSPIEFLTWLKITDRIK